MTAALAHRDIAIIGAGVAGLTAALALAAHGARPRIYEQADALREVGAGLQISANAVRVLDALGLAEEMAANALRSQAVILHDHAGHRVMQLDLAAHRPDDRFYLIHRARLIALLEQATRAAGIPITLNHRIDSPPQADLVIGADGLHSQVRARLNGAATPFFTRQTAWRALIAEPTPPTASASVFMGPGRHLVSYPLGANQRNIVAVVERPDWQEEGWSHQDDPAHLRAAFADFGGPVPAWLAQVERCGIWGLFRHPVAKIWHDDRHVILGDAAHPTLPFMAQGAVMAIEDSWILAACLNADPDQPRALARYQSLRAPRCSAIVAAANGNARNYHLRPPLAQIAHTGLRALNRAAPNKMLRRYDWIYDYDPTAEAI